ncbi:holo-ACP synthase [Salinicoccus siamensis]|uniref:Holo-[acyl-carrier-protein] synthase n=1 Tax=Salinicoccus siamensis TaxID=381830 RepID=A0ABV5Z497_9STAP
MIRGLGTDIIEIERIKAAEDKGGRLSKRILSEEEMEVYRTLSSEKRRMEYLAGRFAVKEAYSKALGSGIGERITFSDITCLNDEVGKPFISGEECAHVSISHSNHYATATVILENKG